LSGRDHKNIKQLQFFLIPSIYQLSEPLTKVLVAKIIYDKNREENGGNSFWSKKN
jgi:hypothetical protein